MGYDCSAYLSWRKTPYYNRGRPAIPFRKVLDGIVCILQIGYQWKMLPRDLVLVQPVVNDFLRWVQIDIFKNIWIRLLKDYGHN
jgi:transposase